ncbi:MAG: 16S rRNA (cytosine(1402)-N(4))-methyltransferase RsmH [bacterium]|nr:16S rRNA (cytosine(1402)-N(4))-methyltransferase RsmH [bacterium]
MEYLAIQPDDTVVDATLGGAGHAIAIAEKLSERGTLIGFDLDADAVARAKDSLASVLPKVHLIEGNFRDVGKKLDECGIPKISKVLFDLGWSSFQLGVGRGFSFLKDEPLQMTYAKNLGTSALTAARIVNEWDESSIADVLYGWGEERYARRIARKIVERRALKPFTTSRELAEMIKESVPAAYRHGRIHPATRTFQALRIAVNDELGALERGLQGAWEHLIPGGPASTRDGEPTRGGRIAVITFHSIEDRLVKQRFVQWEKEGTGRRITKKPVTPSDMELQENPRSRSAKLRIIQKL